MKSVKKSHIPLSPRPFRAGLLAAGLLGAGLLTLTAPGIVRADSIINGEFTPTPSTHKFPYLGNDNGWQERLESIPGRQWLNLQGQPEDAIRLMASSGLNAVRVTVVNQQPLTTSIPIQYDSNGFPVSQNGNENSYNLNYGGVDEQVDIARRCKAYGMKVILTIDIGTDIPAAWAGDNYAQMLTQIDTETKRLLDPFLQAGIQPDIVICSDETNGGTQHIDTSITDAANANPSSPNFRLKDRYVDGGVDANGKPNSYWTVASAVFSTLATGSNTIWPKCAGLHKQAIISARNEITAQGYDVTKTRFGLHSQGTSATGYYDRIFGAHPNQPNYETDYYSNYDTGTTDLGNVSAVPSYLQNVKLSSLVDVLGVSYYPGHPVAGTQTAFEDDLEDIAYNGLQTNCTGQPLNDILNDFSTYGLTTSLNAATGQYTSGPYSGQYAKQAIILETKGESLSSSYLVGDGGRTNPQADGNNPTREANFLTYFLNKLAGYPFMGGALYWEGEYAQFQGGTDLYAAGPFQSRYTYTDPNTGKQVTNPNYNDSPIYQALPVLTTWGQFGAPSATACCTLTNPGFGTALESGQYTGSWSTMQQIGPDINQVFQITTDSSGYFNFLNSGTGFLLSTWNNSKTAGDHVTQTTVSTPPSVGQEWSFIQSGTGTEQIVNNGSGFALDAPNDTSGLQNAVSGASSQQWRTALLPRVNLFNGNGGVLDSGLGNIYGGQWAAIQQFGNVTPTMSQQWKVINDLNGYYRIVCGEILSNNGNVSLALAPYNNSTTIGDHVEQTVLASPIQPGQEWKLVPISGSSAVQIINRSSGLALDAPNGSGVQNTSNPASPSQQWKLTPVY